MRYHGLQILTVNFDIDPIGSFGWVDLRKDALAVQTFSNYESRYLQCLRSVWRVSTYLLDGFLQAKLQLKSD